MNTKSLSNIEKEHFRLFIKNFSPTSALKDRWLYFYGKLNQKYWNEINPWKFWEYQLQRINVIEIIVNDLSDVELISKYRHMIKEVVIVACGHAKPIVMTLATGDFLSRYPSELPIEYVCSLVPGRLALVTNHNGETLLLENNK